MKWFFTILFSILVVATVTAWVLFNKYAPMSAAGENLWLKGYADYARTPLFTAFITLGSFLLTLKTTILQRLREGYDTEAYEKRFLILKGKNPSLKYYGSLERLATALATNVTLSLLTSLFQMTLGFTGRALPVAICLASAFTSILLVFYLTLQMFLSHREWFEKIEEDRCKAVKKREETQHKPA
jgi:hypothetical protein